MLTIIDGGSLTRALKLPIDLRLKRCLLNVATSWAGT